MNTQHSLIRWSLLFLALLLLLSPAHVIQAAGGLPDRDPPPAGSDGRRDSDDSTPPGAQIELAAWPPGEPSVVQWQDSSGGWHDVEGWRGELGSDGTIRWWVAAKDCGSGPFRWVVGNSATPSLTSEPFNLPPVGTTLQLSLSTG
ncbi:MAG: hypothetical protein Kow0031_32630 [Anaerolineae bacterium]